MSPQLARIAELAKEDRKRQFVSIAHLLAPEALYEALESLRKDASAGVDGVTYRDYVGEAKGKVQKLGRAIDFSVNRLTHQCRRRLRGTTAAIFA